MISVFDMAMALTESAEYGFHTGGMNVRPMYIPESMGICESIEYVNNEIMLEAADYVIFSSQVDDLMMEAAMKNPAAIGILTENVITNIGASIKKFFSKILAGIKAIIARIKEFFAKFTGKTDKWVKLIEPRIAKLGGYKGDDTIVNDYSWNESMVQTGLANGIKSVLDDLTGIKSFKEILDCNVVDFDTTLAQKGPSNDSALSSAIATLDKEIDLTKKANEEKSTEFLRAIKIGGGATTLEEFWKNVDKSVRGGEKTDRKASEQGGIDGMMKFIKGPAETAKKLKESYENMHKNYETTAKKWEEKINKMSAAITRREAGMQTPTRHDKSTMYMGVGVTGQDATSGAFRSGKTTSTTDDRTEMKRAYDQGEANMKTAGSAYTSKYQQYIQTKASYMMKNLTTANSIAGGLQSRNLSYLQEITRNYMNNVTKCVAAAGKKNSKD